MKCPVCSESLTRAPYEGIPIFHCSGCHGHLLYPDQVEAAKRRRNQSEEQLSAEAQQAFQNHGELRCPRCRGPMEEQRSSKHSKIFWDYCDACDLVWLDPGELAKIQQERETMLQDHEYQEMRQHWSDRSPEQMTEFQKKLSRQLEAKPKEQPVSTFSAFLDFFFLSSND